MAETLVINSHEDRNNIIVGGHFRLRELKKLGHKEVDCVIVDLNLEDERELNIRLNSNSGEWDMDLLANNFEIPDLESWGLNLDWGLDEEDEPEIEEDEVPELKEESIVKKGDLWILGKNRLLCGDATVITEVEKLMDGEKADLCFTDPPYNMQGVDGGSNQPVGKAAKKLGQTIKHLCDFELESFLNILPTIFNKKIINSYIFCNKDLVPNS